MFNLSSSLQLQASNNVCLWRKSSFSPSSAIRRERFFRSSNEALVSKAGREESEENGRIGALQLRSPRRPVGRPRMDRFRRCGTTTESGRGDQYPWPFSKNSNIFSHSIAIKHFIPHETSWLRWRLHSSTNHQPLHGEVRRNTPTTKFVYLYPHFRTLKPYIRRDYESRPLKLKILDEIRKKCSDPEVKSRATKPIDYVYVQPHHIPAINAICKEFFWNGVDSKWTKKCFTCQC